MVEKSSSQAPLTPSQTVYRNMVRQTATAAERLASGLWNAALDSLERRITDTTDLVLRTHLQDCSRQLRARHEALARAYPAALLTAFARAKVGQRFVGSVPAALHFDDLELMDSSQVHASMVLARLQSAAEEATEAVQSDLDTWVCGLLKLPSVRPEANPLRPESYVAALRSVMEDAGIDESVQVEWLPAMAEPLGKELRQLFPKVAAGLKAAGVVPSGYAVSPGAASGRRSPSPNDPTLTVQRLRALLAGEMEGQTPGNRVDQFAQSFDRQFRSADTAADEPTTDFQNTIPHALEALTEMKQVAKVVQKLEQREAASSEAATTGDPSLEAVRAALRARARNPAQVLSLEVVELMVDNIAQDSRLLEPVQALVRRLEPALLRLSLVDPRFFTDKEHPARLLLQELTQQSLAFTQAQASGFTQFLQEVTGTLEPLQTAEISSAEPFQERLTQLRDGWRARTSAQAGDTAQAMEVLQHAEARNLLAEKIAQDIETLPAALTASRVVVRFLCGPWAQVVAQARLKKGAGSPEAVKYQALVADLLWSVQRDLGREGVAKLTRLVPRMIPVLREGLESVAYPASKTSDFLESLMRLHQRAFKADADQADSILPGTERDRPHWLDDGDPWVDPVEAQASNFVGLEEDSRAPEPEPEPASAPLLPDLDQALERLAQWDQAMILGTWIEIFKAGAWQRLQLTWASPHGTLYLFTSPYGQTQSMTRRTIDRLVEADKMRLVASGSLVDGAMDAVARTALKNSMLGTL